MQLILVLQNAANKNISLYQKIRIAHTLYKKKAFLSGADQHKRRQHARMALNDENNGVTKEGKMQMMTCMALVKGHYPCYLLS
jgi:heme exporter protein D